MMEAERWGCLAVKAGRGLQAMLFLQGVKGVRWPEDMERPL